MLPTDLALLAADSCVPINPNTFPSLGALHRSLCVAPYTQALLELRLSGTIDGVWRIPDW